MIRVFAAVSFVLLVIAAPARADESRIIVDRWWGVDDAKSGCRVEGQDEAGCVERYNVFELELKTQFAALPECAGIAVLSFGYPQNVSDPSPDVSRPYSSFSINYFGDAPAQLWQMLPPNGSSLPMMEATGTPSQIAKQVCAIIKGKGAAVGQ